MRFLSQDLASGELRVAEAPSPAVTERGIVVQNVASLVSAGTERMLFDFARAGLVDKARQQPDRVRQVVDRAVAEGVVETIQAVRSKLSQPIAMGYASAGVVVEAGPGVQGIRPGDVVATNGAHAELVSVPATLAAGVPEGVDPEHACFASVASVALQGIRLAGAEVGERFMVTGLGLVGLLAVQLLRAQGCQVLGVDPDDRRRELAAAMGATVTSPPGAAAEASAARFSRGLGVDGVLICASTRSSEPVREGARASRHRGRLVLVGVTGLELDRSELYERELSLQVSSSYGPGRYEPGYESGRDYPAGFVRWTAGRNMEAVLDLMAAGSLRPDELISHRFDLADAADAYRTLTEDPGALGIVLRYPAHGAEAPPASPTAVVAPAPTVASPGGSGLIGAGNFAARVLAPAIGAAGGRVDVVAAPGGVSAALLARRTGSRATSQVSEVLDDPAIGSVFVATRHDSHARLTLEALRAGKAVFVEKPLAITTSELDKVVGGVADLAHREGGAPVLTVGFNRRFAPVTVRMRELLGERAEPMAVVMTVNAGVVPPGHWTQDPEVGGGRILGEGCHFIDLARHLVGATITEVRSSPLSVPGPDDTATVTMAFADGSTATLHYLANGSPRFPKERVEVFSGGRVLVNDGFRSLRAYGWRRRASMRGTRRDKGHVALVRAFLAAARDGGPPPIPFDELVEVHRAALTAGGRP